jgi:hypothetical protein
MSEIVARPPRIADADEMLDYLDELHRHLSTNYVNVLSGSFGAVGNGRADDTAAINRASAAAGTGILYFPPGTYLVTSKLTQPDYQTWMGAGRFSSYIKKGFNGDLIEAGSIGRFTGLSLLGDGANFTGRGILYSAALPLCVVDNCRIVNFEGYCLSFAAANAGTQFTMRDCEVYRTTLSNTAILLPNDGVDATPRHFFNIQTSGGWLMDFGGCQNVVVEGCFLRNVTFTDDSKKVCLVGNRIATVGDDLTIKGQEHVVSANIVAGDIVLAADTNRCQVRGNIIAGGFTVTDNSGETGETANAVDIPWTEYTPTWTGAGGNPSIGDGALEGRYTREGKKVTVYINVEMGSTTTYGTGLWSFALPFTSHADFLSFTGSARLYDDSPGAHYVAAANIATGAATVQLYSDGGAILSTVPFTWADNDAIALQISYMVG